MRDVLTLPVPHAARLKLRRAGFASAEELQDVDDQALRLSAGLSVKEAAAVVAALDVDRRRVSPQEEVEGRVVTTASRALDAILEGGVALGTLTELCGTPGSGKTQLCLQLATSVQVPPSLGGLDGHAVFVDTAGGFSRERFAEVAAATVERCQVAAASEADPACWADLASFSVDSILAGTYYVPCLDRTQLSAAVDVLVDFVAEHPAVRLVIIDSVVFPLRGATDFSYGDRTALLLRMAQRLNQLAWQRSLAVVVTNQMTTRFSGDEDSYLAAALGDAWSHACATRLMMRRRSGHHFEARVVKSSSLPDATTAFAITEQGVRDDH